LFWPSPPKKAAKKAFKEIFPACCSTSKWRELYLHKATAKSAKKESSEKDAPKNRSRVKKTKKANTQDQVAEMKEKDQSGGKIRKVSEKAAAAKNRNRPTSTDNEDDDDEPLSAFVVNSRKKKSKRCKLSKKVTKTKIVDGKNSSQCKQCHFTYEDPMDPLKGDEWLQCGKCQFWLHETCAQNYGVFVDDDGYLCKNCL